MFTNNPGLTKQQLENNKMMSDDIVFKALALAHEKKLEALEDLIGKMIDDLLIVAEKNAFELTLEQHRIALAKLIIQGIETQVERAEFLEALQEKMRQFKRQMEEQDLTLHAIHRQNRLVGILESQLETEQADPDDVLATMEDAGLALTGEALDPFVVRKYLDTRVVPSDLDKITANGTYIFKPQDISETTLNIESVSGVTKALDIVGNEHPDKDLRILIPVTNGNHWRLVDAKLEKGKLTAMTLWDPGKQAIEPTPSYEAIQKSADDLTKPPVTQQPVVATQPSTQPVVEGVELPKGIKVNPVLAKIQAFKNNCFDLVNQKAIQIKYEKTEPADPLTKSIKDEKDQEQLRAHTAQKVVRSRNEKVAPKVKEIAETVALYVTPSSADAVEPTSKEIKNGIFNTFSELQKTSQDHQLRNEFDTLVARNLSKLYAESEAEFKHEFAEDKEKMTLAETLLEKSLLHIARDQAYAQFLSKYGFFPASNTDYKPVDKKSESTYTPKKLK